MRGELDGRGRALDDVLIHAERLVELSKCLLESMRNGRPFGVVEALEVHAADPVDEADRTRLREEGRLVHEAPE